MHPLHALPELGCWSPCVLYWIIDGTLSYLHHHGDSSRAGAFTGLCVFTAGPS